MEISLNCKMIDLYNNNKIFQQNVGDLVGYTVRFQDSTSERTQIKYLTDGMLLREAMFDKMLKEYTVIILDEAHERTIHTDVLFGVVKNAQKLREGKSISALKVSQYILYRDNFMFNLKIIMVKINKVLSVLGLTCEIILFDIFIYLECTNFLIFPSFS